jgi:hypothetical protein
MAVKSAVLLCVVLASLLVYQDAACATELTQANGLLSPVYPSLCLPLCMDYVESFYKEIASVTILNWTSRFIY